MFSIIPFHIACSASNAKFNNTLCIILQLLGLDSSKGVLNLVLRVLDRYADNKQEKLKQIENYMQCTRMSTYQTAIADYITV
jgi:hypothetical protein